MGVGDPLLRLGQFLEECDRRAERVALADPCVSVAESGATAEVELTFEMDRDAEGSIAGPHEASLDDGTFAVTFEASDVLPADHERVDLDPVDATFGPDASVTVSLTATVDAASDDAAGDEPLATEGDGVTAPEADAAPEDDAARDRDVPPFEDERHLTEIYASCDTFAEMSEAIEMDVTAETVRRYMIENGVHEPRSYDTAGADDGADEAPDESSLAAESSAATAGGQPPEVLTDGMGLPESVTADDIVDAVDTSETIYEVGRAIGIERMEALEMLQQLDLLEFVMGRLSRGTEREASRDEILNRIRRASDTR